MSLKNYLKNLFNKSNSEKLPENWVTKSKNLSVLEVYQIVYNSENVDTDYWWTGTGGSSLIENFQFFTEQDWNDLENDLSLDMDVETIVGIVRKAKDGTDIYSYKFKAIKK